jgi:hypothetical protein
MQVSISNFRGIKDAEFDLANITIIGGENGAGKTSIMQAISAALTGECPVKDLKKQDYKYLVKIGKTTANIEIKNENGRAVMQFPDGKGYTDGSPPFTSVYASGLQSPLDMKKSDATECWISLLKAEPTIEDLEKELAKEGVANCDGVVKAVAAKGWDGAVAQFKEEGTKLKGKWESITGERYGTSKGESWQPEGLSLTDTREGLEGALNAKKTAYDESIKTNAISDYERAGLAAKATNIKELKTKLAEAEKDNYKKIHEANSAEQKYIDMQNAENPYKCPHCGKMVKIDGKKLIPADAPATNIGINVDKIIKEQKEKETACKESYQKVAAIKAELKSAEDALQKLNSSTVAEPNTTAADELQAAKNALAAYDAHCEAIEVHKKIISYIEIVKLLAPEGLRKRHLESALRGFNNTLKKLCEEAEWGTVAIEPDLSVSFEEKPYLLLSESEQYRTRCTIQAALAMLDKSELLIFDRADLLTKKGRNGLFALCIKTGLRSIIFLSANDKTDIPNLTDSNTTFWIDNGTII